MNAAPRRYSIAAPDFDPEIGNRLIITVDGDHLRDVAAYDCAEGWVETAAHDDSGEVIREFGCFCVRRYWGEVRAVII